MVFYTHWGSQYRWRPFWILGRSGPRWLAKKCQDDFSTS